MKKRKPKLRQFSQAKLQTFGGQLAFWRESRLMGQAELAAILSISVRTLRDYERADTTFIPGWIHWALKGLEAPTRRASEFILKLDRTIIPADVTLLNDTHLANTPAFVDKVAGIKIWLEVVPAPIFLPNPPGVPMADPLDNPYYKQVDAAKEAARLRRNELQRQRYRENK